MYITKQSKAMVTAKYGIGNDAQLWVCLLCLYSAERSCRDTLLCAGDKSELGHVARQSKQDGH